jgi:hypothetical protein
MHTDLHLTARQALDVGLVHEIKDFSPLPGTRLINI